MVSRRKILIAGSASIVIIGIGATAVNILHSDLSPARRPWAHAGGDFGDVRLNALSYAILAPNPHNRQPWIARLEGEDRLSLYCDLDRLLPQTDPENRQIVIGLGAFLELLRQAAAEGGHRLEIEQFPEGEPHPVLDERPVAHVQFIPDTDVLKESLFGAVLARRTVRAEFDRRRPVADGVLNRLNAALRPGDGVFQWANDAPSVSALKEICRKSWRIEATTARTHHESVSLMRIGEKEINEQPDGLFLSGPLMEAMRVTGALTREALDKQGSFAHRSAVEFYERAIATAMAFGWLATGGNSRADQLDAGAGWMRLHLAATREGLAMHPLSQALQEFPEMAEMLMEIHEFTDIRAPGRVQGLFRFGYVEFPQPAPRWPLSSRIVNANA